MKEVPKQGQHIRVTYKRRGGGQGPLVIEGPVSVVWKDQERFIVIGGGGISAVVAWSNPLSAWTSGGASVEWKEIE